MLLRIKEADKKAKSIKKDFVDETKLKNKVYEVCRKIVDFEQLRGDNNCKINLAACKSALNLNSRVIFCVCKNLQMNVNDVWDCKENLRQIESSKVSQSFFI